MSIYREPVVLTSTLDENGEPVPACEYAPHCNHPRCWDAYDRLEEEEGAAVAASGADYCAGCDTFGDLFGCHVPDRMPNPDR